MSDGKFSKPRPYRDEEREIEQAFRQITGQAPPPEPVPEDLGSLNEELLDGELLPEELLCQAFPQPEMEGLPPEPDQIPRDQGRFLREEEPPEPDFIDQMQVYFREAVDYCRKNPKMVVVGLCALALVMILGFTAAFFFSTSDPYGGRILSNVYIGDVNVGGMTKSEAVSAVKDTAALSYAREDMVVSLSGTVLHLKPADTKVSLDAKAAVNAAYSYGRTGSKEEREQIYRRSASENHFIGLLPYLSLDKDYIRQVLADCARDTGSTLTQTAYGLEGPQPELSAENFNESAPVQTLVITVGTPGIGFDPQEVYEQVLDAYSLHQFRVEVENVQAEKEPEDLDLEAVYQEFYIAPVDATIDMQTFETIPGSYGYHFDVERARQLLDNAAYGEVLRIPMEYIKPEILDEDVLFRDVLGSHETRHSDNRDRTTNLKIACQALDGLVLDPGEEFSYNDALGKRTEDKGYKPAPSYSGLETVDTIGGGICQVSSTLYYSVLLADLSVTDRTNHGFVPTYIDYGMDATVSWGNPDFKFRNSTNYPIKIEAEVSDGYVKIQILGTDEKDYDVKMDYTVTDTYEPKTDYKDFAFDNKEGYKDGDVIVEGRTGYLVKTYKLKYDRETGKLLSRDFEASSRYLTVNRVVARVAPQETAPPTTEETEPPTTEETEPPTTQAPEPPTSAPTDPPEGGDPDNGDGEDGKTDGGDNSTPGEGIDNGNPPDGGTPDDGTGGTPTGEPDTGSPDQTPPVDGSNVTPPPENPPDGENLAA